MYNDKKMYNPISHVINMAHRLELQINISKIIPPPHPDASQSHPIHNAMQDLLEELDKLAFQEIAKNMRRTTG